MGAAAKEGARGSFDSYAVPGNRAHRLETQPEARCRIRSYAFWCLQGAYIASLRQSCKQKTAPKDRSNRFSFLNKTGAGEGIRTLDPNLGKVVLYP